MTSKGSKILDDRDRHLLTLLEDNARRPLVSLARAIGLSRSATQERLRRLESSGAITGYTVRLGSEDAPVRVQAWLQIRFKAGMHCAHVAPAIVSRPGIRLCHSVAGPVDLMALAEVAAVSDLTALRESIAALPGVAGVETSLVLSVHLDRSHQRR